MAMISPAIRSNAEWHNDVPNQPITSGPLLGNGRAGDTRGTMREAFERDGYVVLNGVFSDSEVTAMKQEIDRVLGLNGSDPLPGLNPAELESFQNHGVFVGLAAHSKEFHEAAKQPEIVNALRQIIGDRIIFLSDKVVRKNATTEFASPWHQDWPYWKGSHKFSVWIALDPATRDNGCLKIVPGSHRLGELTHDGETNDGLGFANRLEDSRIDENDVIPVELDAGSVVVFHDLLFHASYPNTSGKSRYALISTYMDGGADDPEYSWASAKFTVSPVN